MYTLLPAALLWLGALRLHRAKGLAPAAAHLYVLLGSVLALSAAAMLNVLPYATAALFAYFALGTVLDIRRRGLAAWGRELRAFCTRPVCLALAAGLVLVVVFAVQQPIFTYWDEFFIAGTNAKALKLSHLLYGVLPSPATSIDDPCATAVLSYLYQFFSPTFREADCYLAYAYFFFAVFSAAAELVDRTAGRHAGVLLFLALAFTPFLQGFHTIFPDYGSISYGYINCMADYSLAVGMFACVVLYLAAPEARWYYLAMVYTCLLKEAGVLLAAVAAAVLAVWRLRGAAHGVRGVWRWAGGAVADLFAAIAGYLAWMVYLQLRGSASPAAGIAVAAVLLAAALLWRVLGEARRTAIRTQAARLAQRLAVLALPVGIAGVALVLLVLRFSGRFSFAAGRIWQAINILRGLVDPAQQSPDIQAAWQAIGEAFLQEHLFLPFTDVVTVALLFLLVLAGCLLCRERGSALCLGASQLVLALGALGYLAVTAYFVSGYMQREGMMEYPRYFSSYLFGWLYIALLLVLLQPGRAHWGQLLSLAAALLCVGSVARMGLDHTVIAAPQNYQQGSREIRERVAAAADMLTPEDHLYLIIQTLDGYSILAAGFDLYPIQINRAKVDTDIDYSIIFCAERDPNDPYSPRYHLATAAEFAQLVQRNFDYVLVMGDDGTCARDYGDLFEGGFEIGGLYRVDTDPAVPFVRVG